MTIHSEKVVLLALSLCCFIYDAVLNLCYFIYDAVFNFNVCLMRNLIVTVPEHCLSSTLRPMPYISNALENWHFCPRHHIMGNEQTPR